MALNPRKPTIERLADEVIELLPPLPGKDGVVGGRRDRLRRHDARRGQVLSPRRSSSPRSCDLPVHDPHPAPRQEARHAADHGRRPGARDRPAQRVIVDHNTEETVRRRARPRLLGRFTSIPAPRWQRAHGRARARYGAERILVDSAADWGVSDPLAVPKTATPDAERGIPRRHAPRLLRPTRSLLRPERAGPSSTTGSTPAPVDQRTLYEGNSVLRGQTPRVDARPSRPNRSWQGARRPRRRRADAGARRRAHA